MSWRFLLGFERRQTIRWTKLEVHFIAKAVQLYAIGSWFMLEHKYFSHLILSDLETSSASVYQSSSNRGSNKSFPSIGEVSDKVLYLKDTWKPQNCSKIHPPYVCQLKQAVWIRKWLEWREENRGGTVKTSPQEMRTIHNTPANHPQIGLQQCTRCEPNATTFHVFQLAVNNKKKNPNLSWVCEGIWDWHRWTNPRTGGFDTEMTIFRWPLPTDRSED